MFAQEAEWLCDELCRLPAQSVSPLLNLGSGDAKFRSETQPWIDERLFTPLRNRGIEILHCDLKSSAGVDLIADIFDSDGFQRLFEVGAKTILLNNVLEHVVDRTAFAARCQALTPDGGYLGITVPQSYPYHADPIDTLYRPDEESLQLLFPELEKVRSTTLMVPSSYRQRIRTNWLHPLGDLAMLPYFLVRYGSVRMSRLAWIGRPFRETCALFRRSPTAAPTL